jgi:hypothetical protein
VYYLLPRMARGRGISEGMSDSRRFPSTLKGGNAARRLREKKEYLSIDRQLNGEMK